MCFPHIASASLCRPLSRSKLGMRDPLGPSHAHRTVRLSRCVSLPSLYVPGKAATFTACRTCVPCPCAPSRDDARHPQMQAPPPLCRTYARPLRAPDMPRAVDPRRSSPRRQRSTTACADFPQRACLARARRLLCVLRVRHPRVCEKVVAVPVVRVRPVTQMSSAHACVFPESTRRRTLSATGTTRPRACSSTRRRRGADDARCCREPENMRVSRIAPGSPRSRARDSADPS